MSRKTKKSRNKNNKKHTKQIKREVRRRLDLNTTGMDVPSGGKKGQKKRMPLVTIGGLFAFLSLIIAILAFWLQTKPTLAVSSFTQADSKDPMNTYFTISNNGVLALIDVRFNFTTDIVAGTTVLHDLQTSGNEGQQDVGIINPGQKVSESTGISLENFNGYAEIEIDVAYFPQYYPQLSIFERHAIFKFKSIKTSEGYSWIEQPSD